jgi:tetratricopeptide (TPR) repeat protein
MRSRIIAIALFLSVLSPVLAGPKTKTYPYTVPPNKAFELLAKLDKVSSQPLALSADEIRLFADAADGKLDSVSFDEACLIASGATDHAKLQAYLKKLDELEKQARKDLEGAKTPYEKGKKLLEFIHAGPMAKGYVSGQTNLDALLDTGKFNCVSSAVLYNVLGRRFGLDLWAIEIPEHVFSCLHDGDKRIEIETTNKLGFDPSRDPEARKKVMPAGKVYMPARNTKDRREINELQLVAVICSNQSVELSKANKHREAIHACFRTLCLDPKHEQAARNVLAHFMNWGVDLMKHEKFEEALAVIDVGLELAPGDSGLKNNRKVAYQDYAAMTLKAGKTNEAVAILKRAEKQVGDKEFGRAQAELFMRRGEQILKAKGLDAAVELAEQGLKAIDGKPRKELLEWRNGLFLRQANDLVRKHDYEAALAMLQRGKALDPTFKGFQQNTIATFCEWAGTYMKKKDWAGAIKIYEKGLEQCPGDGILSNNIKYCKQQQAKK